MILYILVTVNFLLTAVLVVSQCAHADERVHCWCTYWGMSKSERGFLGVNFGVKRTHIRGVFLMQGFRRLIERSELQPDRVTHCVARLSTEYSTNGVACREPEALPFCALAYALIGIISTLLIAAPGATNLLMAIAGQA